MSATEQQRISSHSDESDEKIRLVTVINPALMSLDQACRYLGIPKGTLYQWRSQRPGYGPRAVLAGRILKFRKADLDAWIEERAEPVDNPVSAARESEGGRQSDALPSMTRKRRSPVRLAG